MLFRVLVPGHCVYDVLLIFSSALLGGPSDSTHDIEGATFLVESGVVLSLGSSVHSVEPNFGLLSIFQGSQFDYRQAYLAYYCSFEENWDYKACVWWLPFTQQSGKVLDIPASEVTSYERDVKGVQVKHFVRSVLVRFKPGPRKTIEKAFPAVNAGYGFSSAFPGLSDDVCVLEDEVVIENPP